MKVRLETNFRSDRCVYTVSSTSLTAAMQRATLLIEALGERDITVTHVVKERKKKKNKHFVFVSVGLSKTVRNREVDKAALV